LDVHPQGGSFPPPFPPLAASLVLLLGGREESGGEKRRGNEGEEETREGRGLPPLYLTSGYGPVSSVVVLMQRTG